MPVRIQDKDLGWKRIGTDIAVLRESSVKVGFMGNEQAEGVSVVDYMMYNEFGTNRIPARPFMSTTANLYGKEIGKFAEFLAGRIIDGAIGPTHALQNIGEKYQSYIQKTIRDAKNWAVPNADSTIARKGSSSPLIDKGRAVQSVRYEVTIGTAAKTAFALSKPR